MGPVRQCNECEKFITGTERLSKDGLCKACRPAKVKKPSPWVARVYAEQLEQQVRQLQHEQSTKRHDGVNNAKVVEVIVVRTTLEGRHVAEYFTQNGERIGAIGARDLAKSYAASGCAI